MQRGQQHCLNDLLRKKKSVQKSKTGAQVGSKAGTGENVRGHLFDRNCLAINVAGGRDREGLSLAIWWSRWNLFNWSNTYEGHPYSKSISREARRVILAPACSVCSMQSVFFPANYLYSNLNNFNLSYSHEYGISWKLFTFIAVAALFLCLVFHYVCLLRAQLCLVNFAEKDLLGCNKRP